MQHGARSDGEHMGVWLDDAPRDLVRAHLAEHGAGWSVGTWGAIGEFRFDAAEAGLELDIDTLTVATPRGALRVTTLEEARPLAIAVGPRGRLREIAFCLPAERARGNGRTVLSEVGPDRAAIDSGGRTDVLFDVGVAAEHVDVYVRIAERDAATVAALRAGLGRPLLEPGNAAAAAAVLTSSPPRIFVSALARLEVKTPIPPPGGRSPEGPHSHLLPGLLAERRPHAPGAPIPPGWVCGLSLYPVERR